MLDSVDFVSLLIAGARQIATGLNIARQTNKRIFVTSMCIGSGMGMAAVLVSEN
jgi:acetyl-CoA acyltransferase 1